MNNDKLPSMQQVAEYLDNGVPLQQLDQLNDLTSDDEPTFIHAQLAFAKSKHGKQIKRNKSQNKRRWQAGKGGKK